MTLKFTVDIKPEDKIVLEKRVYNLRGEPVWVPFKEIKKILPTLREGVKVLHKVDGGWFFIVDEDFIEFTEDEGEDTDE